jgi:hypothetical protein
MTLLEPDRQALLADVEARLVRTTARFESPQRERPRTRLRPATQSGSATRRRATDDSTLPVRRGPAGEPLRAEPGTDSSAGGGQDRGRAQPPASREAALDAPEAGPHTTYAGMLFLLATAAEAGLPDRLLDDPRLVDLPLPWCVHAVGCMLAPVEIDDPAVLALAGLAAPPDRDQEPDGAELEAVADAAAAWRSATVQRVRESGGPGAEEQDAEAVFERVVRRSGAVLQQTGWIEVVLDVADTDVVVRRAGLDLDPGWVPWIGAVVRFRYE